MHCMTMYTKTETQWNAREATVPFAANLNYIDQEHTTDRKFCARDSMPCAWPPSHLWPPCRGRNPQTERQHVACRAHGRRQSNEHETRRSRNPLDVSAEAVLPRSCGALSNHRTSLGHRGPSAWTACSPPRSPGRPHPIRSCPSSPSCARTSAPSPSRCRRSSCRRPR